MALAFLRRRNMANTHFVGATESRVTVWDGWRGLAIALVLCGHFFDLPWIHEDRMGVDVFFGLSGMLMSIILFEKKISLRDFYIRRFSRIFPALLFLVLCLFTLAALQSHTIAPMELPASLLFIRTYFPQSPHIWETQTSTAHLWSLNIEEHAYILMSALAITIAGLRSAATVMALVGVLSVAIACYYFSTNPPDQFELLSIRTESAISFIFFSATYGLLKRRGNWKIRSPFIIALILLVPTCYIYSTPLALRFTIAPLLLGIVVNHLQEIEGIARAFLNSRLLRWLGACSFSIYLWQQPFFEYAYAIPGGLPVGMVLSIIAGAMSYYLLEQPVRKAINSRWSPKPVYRPAGAPA
jgi:peptidoglycan/LPS O-acetylase OafA/YrhL